MNAEDVKSVLADYILEKHLQGEDKAALMEAEGLVSDGILDSMASLMLVSFIEEHFQVAIPAHQIDADHLDSLDRIVTSIQSNAKAA